MSGDWGDVATAERRREQSRKALDATERERARLEERRRQALPARAFADESFEVPAFAWRDPAVSSELEQARRSARLARAAAKVEAARLAQARSELETFDARVAGDLTRHGKREGCWEALRRTAVFAERRNAANLAAIGPRER